MQFKFSKGQGANNNRKGQFCFKLSKVNKNCSHMAKLCDHRFIVHRVLFTAFLFFIEKCVNLVSFSSPIDSNRNDNYRFGTRKLTSRLSFSMRSLKDSVQTLMDVGWTLRDVVKAVHQSRINAFIWSTLYSRMLALFYHILINP